MIVTSARQNETQIGRKEIQPIPIITTSRDIEPQQNMADGNGSGAPRPSVSERLSVELNNILWTKVNQVLQVDNNKRPQTIDVNMTTKELISQSCFQAACKQLQQNDMDTDDDEIFQHNLLPTSKTTSRSCIDDDKIATDTQVDINNISDQRHHHATVIRKAACKLSSSSASSTYLLSTIISNKKLALIMSLVLGSYCLLLTAPIGVVHCAPTTRSTSKSIVGSPVASLIPSIDRDILLNSESEEREILSSPSKHDEVDDYIEGKTSQLAPVIVNNQKSVADPMSVVDAEASSQSEDDSIILILADKLDSSPSSQSVRRLIKRSGISDQRLAEIQMIRALKKQLEKATKVTATNSAGQDGSQAAS